MPSKQERNYFKWNYFYDHENSIINTISSNVESKIAEFSKSEPTGDLKLELIRNITLQTREAWLRRLAGYAINISINGSRGMLLAFDNKHTSSHLKPDKSDFPYLDDECVDEAFEAGLHLGARDFLSIAAPFHEEDETARQIYFHSWSEEQLSHRALREDFEVKETPEGGLFIDRDTSLPHVAIRHRFQPHRLKSERSIAWSEDY